MDFQCMILRLYGGGNPADNALRVDDHGAPPRQLYSHKAREHAVFRGDLMIPELDT